MTRALHHDATAGTDAGTTDETPPDGEGTDSWHRLRAMVIGLEGGAFATLVMTAFRMPISHSLPPTANFWARFFGDGDPEDYPLPAFVLHVLYGVAGGAVFGLLFEERGGRTRAGIELTDIARGVVYSLVFSVFGSRVVLGRVVGMDLESDEALIFHVGHAIYGLAIGAWMGSNR